MKAKHNTSIPFTLANVLEICFYQHYQHILQGIIMTKYNYSNMCLISQRQHVIRRLIENKLT